MWVCRRSENPSPTDVVSYWPKPRLSTIGTSVKFITAADSLSTANNVDSELEPSSFKDDTINIGNQNQLDGQIIKYNLVSTEDKLNVLSI